MDDNLKLFENPDFGDVRVLLDEKHEPWFVGNDVAKCLGYADPRRPTIPPLFTINMLAR